MVITPIFSGITIHVPSCFFSCSPVLADAFLKRGGRLTTEPTGLIYCCVVPASHQCLSCKTDVTPSASKEHSEADTSDISARFAISPSWIDVIPSFSRQARIPVLYDRWIDACIEEGVLLPWNDHPERRLLVYDPFMFQDVCFTTTQLPRTLKHNVVALLIFYGAHYSPDLTEDTDMVVFFRLRSFSSASHSLAPSHTSSSAGRTKEEEREKSASPIADAVERLQNTTFTTLPHPSPTPMTMACSAPNRSLPHPLTSPSRKLEAAKAHHIPCVTPGWVQQCVYAGRLLDIASPSLLPTPFMEGCSPTSTEVGPEPFSPSPSSLSWDEEMTHSENKQGKEASCGAALSFVTSSPSPPLLSLSSEDPESSMGPPAASFPLGGPSTVANVCVRKAEDSVLSTPSSPPSLEGMETHPPPFPTVRITAPLSSAPVLVSSTAPLPWLSNAFYEEDNEEVERGIPHEMPTVSLEKHPLVSTKTKRKRKRKKKKGKKAGLRGMWSKDVPHHCPLMEKIYPTPLLSF